MAGRVDVSRGQQGWRTFRLVIDGWRAVRGGESAVAARQRARLQEIVAFARTNSPYYGALYRELPADVEHFGWLPVTNKRRLMAQYDEWATDRRATEAAARAFVDRRERVGDWFLNQYTVATTSGTTGFQGVFIIDHRSFAVATAMGARMLGAWLGVSDVMRILAAGRRLAMVNAMGGHFASAIAATRLRRRSPGRVAVFPVDAPLPEIVRGLNVPPVDSRAICEPWCHARRRTGGGPATHRPRARRALG